MNKRLAIVVASMVCVGSSVSQASFKASPIAEPRVGGGMPFAFQFSLGVLNGDATEHVYDYENPDGSRRQLSRLDWDLKNIVMGGGKMTVRLQDRLTLNGGLWVALSKGSGEMEDFDWMRVETSDPTHYSLSDVDLTAGYILDVNAGFDFFRNESLTATVFVGYKQDGWTWEDSAIYLLYPEYDYVPQFLNGMNMINYEQEFRMPYLGCSVELAVQQFSLSGYLTYAPYIWATDWDEHVARDMHFKETFDGGDMLGAGLEARYEFTQGTFDGFFLSAGLDYQKIDLIIGDMEYRNIVTGATGGGKDVAGIDNEYVVFSFGGGVRF